MEISGVDPFIETSYFAGAYISTSLGIALIFALFVTTATRPFTATGDFSF